MIQIRLWLYKKSLDNLKEIKYGFLHLDPRPPFDWDKWVFRNKLDENETVVINKPRLVVEGCNQ